VVSDHWTMDIQKYNSNNDNTSWIENLALEELNMNESGVVNFNQHLNPEAYLEESSINFMKSLRDQSQFFVEKFNQFRGSNKETGQIKIFKISNTVNDFMLFRNSLRMIFTRKANDLITIGFLSNNGEVYPARLSVFDSQKSDPNGAHEIMAHVGPFSKITWRFGGEPVDMHALVKHYLSEFIRQSAR
jgi:hypothetical protein